MGAGPGRLLLGRAHRERTAGQDPDDLLQGRPLAVAAPPGEHANLSIHARHRARGRGTPAARNVCLMIFHVVAVGRVRHAALREACEDYLRRAGRYFKLQVLEIADATRGGRPLPDAIRVEGDALLGKIPKASVVVALSRDGESEDSRGFDDRMARWQRDARDV